MNGLNNQFFFSSQQPTQVQSHAFLSSIRDIQASDNEENLKKKREQQIAYAESLRKQIDEKRQKIYQQENKKCCMNQFKDTQQRNEPHFTFGEEELSFPHMQKKEHTLSNFGNNKQLDFSCPVNFETLLNKPAKNASKNSQKQILTKADLSQFDLFSTSGKLFGYNSTFMNHNPIQISTDSPFATSTVSTPPQGFSMRCPYISQNQTFSDPVDSRTVNSIFDNFSIANHQNTMPSPHDSQPNKYNNNLIVNSKLASTVTKKTTYRPPQIHSRAKSMLLHPIGMKNTVQLNNVSELVYPDGHFSPAVSPRGTSF